MIAVKWYKTGLVALFVLICVLPVQLLAAPTKPPKVRIIVGKIQKDSGGRPDLAMDGGLSFGGNFSANNLVAAAAALDGRRVKITYHLEDGKSIVDAVSAVNDGGGPRNELGTIVDSEKGIALNTPDGRKLVLNDEDYDLSFTTENLKGRRVKVYGYDDLDTQKFVLQSAKAEPVSSHVTFMAGAVAATKFVDTPANYKEADINCDSGTPCRAKTDRSPVWCFKGPPSSVCNAMKQLAAKVTDEQLAGAAEFGVTVQSCDWTASSATVVYALVSYDDKPQDILVQKTMAMCAL